MLRRAVNVSYSLLYSYFWCDEDDDDICVKIVHIVENVKRNNQGMVIPSSVIFIPCVANNKDMVSFTQHMVFFISFTVFMISTFNKKKKIPTHIQNFGTR